MIERLEATVDHVLTCQTQALKIGRSLAPNHQYYRVGAPGLSGAPRRHGKPSTASPRLGQVKNFASKASKDLGSQDIHPARALSFAHLTLRRTFAFACAKNEHNMTYKP